MQSKSPECVQQFWLRSFCRAFLGCVGICVRSLSESTDIQIFQVLISQDPLPPPTPQDVELYPQSTYIYRASQCMSPRWNWDSPTPLAASECALPPGPKGGGPGGHTRLRLKGWGSPNSNDWRNAKHSAYSVIISALFMYVLRDAAQGEGRKHCSSLPLNKLEGKFWDAQVPTLYSGFSFMWFNNPKFIYLMSSYKKSSYQTFIYQTSNYRTSRF